MTRMTIALADGVVEKLAKVATSRSRRQSEFVATAIRRALWELEEKETAAACTRQPDSDVDAYFDPDVWEPSCPAGETRRWPCAGAPSA